MRRALLYFGLVALVAIAGLAAASGSSSAASAKALEASLLSPCCFGGTLDVHDSDISRALRAEIERRVASGESTRAIESDMVARYGPQVRALPSGRSFLGFVVAALAAALLGGVALLRAVLRRPEGARLTTAPSPPSASALRDPYDDRLDAELEALDHA